MEYYKGIACYGFNHKYTYLVIWPENINANNEKTVLIDFVSYKHLMTHICVTPPSSNISKLILKQFKAFNSWDGYVSGKEKMDYQI